MSYLRPITEGPEEMLSVLEEKSLNSKAQNEVLRKEPETLSSLQKTLSDVERKAKDASRQLRSKEGELLMLEAEVEDQELKIQSLHDQCASIIVENTKLQDQIREERENACTAQAGFNIYRSKMERHRQVVLHAVSQTDAHRELEEMRALVRRLAQEKEELEKDMKTTDGQHIQMAKEENDVLKEEIIAMKEIVAEKEKELQKEYETQAEIKKDIEIQNKRYHAIVKHLRCQLIKTQAAHRLMSGDV